MSLPNDPVPPSGTPSVRTSARRPASRAGLLIGGVVVLLAAAWAGSTAYSAGQAEQVSDTLARTLETTLKSRQLGSIERHTFTRGLTSSTDDLYLVLGQDGNTYRLHLRNHIQHGPLPGLTQVGQAAVDTEIVWDAGTQAQLDKAFRGKKPVIHTLIGLGGDTDTTVQIPSGLYTSGGATATWQALEGRFRVSDAGRGVQGELTWPGGSVGSSEGMATLKDMRYTAEQRPYLKHLSQGMSRFSLASIRLPGTLGHLDDLSAVTTTAPSSTTLGSRTELTAKGLSAEGQTFSALKVILSATGLSSTALEGLAEVMQRPEYRQALNGGSDAASPEATLNRLATDLKPALRTLLAGNPLLAVNEVSMQTPQGPLKLALDAQVVDGGSIPLDELLNARNLESENRDLSLLSLLGHLRLTADIEGAQQAIAGLLGSSGDRTAAGIAESIDPMVQQGLITRSGDTLKTHLEFGKDGASINGKPVPLQ